MQDQLLKERVDELGRERATSRKLAETLDAQLAVSIALSKTLDRLPSSVEENLNKEDNQLAKILNGINATQTR
jgi:hypothetical protein